jgi:hypothetical protein
LVTLDKRLLKASQGIIDIKGYFQTHERHNPGDGHRRVAKDPTTVLFFHMRFPSVERLPE